MGRMSYYKMWVVDLANQGKKPGLSNKKRQALWSCRSLTFALRKQI